MVGVDQHGRAPQHLVRELAGALGEAQSLDEVVRSTFRVLTRLPGVVRAGLALNRSGGRQLQLASSDEAELRPAVRWSLIDAFDKVPLNDAVLSGEDVYLGSFAEVVAGYPELAVSQERLGARSLAALALATDEQHLGGLMLSFDHEQPFDEAARSLLGCLAAQVTQALRRESMQLMPGSTAEALQRSLMPTLPQPEGLRVSARYHPGGLTAQVGGDWYDVFDLPGGATAVVVGDVMGKGVQAAILMGEVRTALRAYAAIDQTPSAVLRMLDRYVALRAEPDLLVTLVYGLVSRDRRRVSLSIAGHPPPMLVRPHGAPRALEEALGPALGLGAGPWRDASVELAPGDTLFAFSDGLVQGRDTDVFAGIDRLREHAAQLPARRRRPRDLCSESRRVMAGILNEDDVTMLAVGRLPDGVLRDASLGLPTEATAARAARRFLRETLAGWGVVGDVVDTAQLCVSELVTNAVIHGGPRKEVSLELDAAGWLTVLVNDSGGNGVVAELPDEDLSLVSGRGLGLVDALSASWSAEHTQDGTTVWFELQVPVPADRSVDGQGRATSRS